MKKALSILLSLAMLVALSVSSYATSYNDVFDSESINPHLVVKRVYFAQEMPSLMADVQEEAEPQTGSRPKKWVFTEISSKGEWTDYGDLLLVVKSQNGSTISGSATASRGVKLSHSGSLSSGAISLAVGYEVSSLYSVTGTSTAQIPKNCKKAEVRAYPVYEVTHFKAKLVHSIGATVYATDEGDTYKPVGVDFVFSFS